MSSGTWVRLRKGVYADGAAYRELEPFHDGSGPADPGSSAGGASVPVVFSHDSAAIVLRLGAPDPRTSAVHIAQPTSPRHDHVRRYRHPRRTLRSRRQVCEVDGLRVLNRARTALDMAREHGLWPGMAACDAALRQGASTSRARGRWPQRMRKWPYKRRVDRAISLADPGAESYLESLGRGLVHELGIGMPQTQFGLTDGGRTIWGDIRVGRHLFETDGKLKYVLEEDGRTPDRRSCGRRSSGRTSSPASSSGSPGSPCTTASRAGPRRCEDSPASTPTRWPASARTSGTWRRTSPPQPRVTGRTLHSRPH